MSQRDSRPHSAVGWVLLTRYGGEWAADIDDQLYETAEEGRAALAEALDLGYPAVLAEVVPVGP